MYLRLKKPTFLPSLPLLSQNFPPASWKKLDSFWKLPKFLKIPVGVNHGGKPGQEPGFLTIAEFSNSVTSQLMRKSLIYSRESCFLPCQIPNQTFPLRYLLLSPLFPLLPVEPKTPSWELFSREEKRGCFLVVFRLFPENNFQYVAWVRSIKSSFFPQFSSFLPRISSRFGKNW